MSQLTFDEFLKQFTQIYEEKAYQQAYELVEYEATLFPDPNDVPYLRMCMAACMKNTGLALQIFREALEAGVWFAPDYLRDDDDLQSLQELPEYQEMVAICERKRGELQEQMKPDLVV